MSTIVQTMMKEEPEVNLTPMIDVVFLLLIFFMLQKFRTYENKLPSQLPLDQGLSPGDIKDLTQLRFDLLLVPGSQNQIQIKPDPNVNPFYFINFKSGKEGKKQMFKEVRDMIIAGWDTYKMDKIEISPQSKVPFDYVALLLNAVHSAKAEKEAVEYELIKEAKKNKNLKLAEEIENTLVKVTFKASKMEKYD